MPVWAIRRGSSAPSRTATSGPGCNTTGSPRPDNVRVRSASAPTTSTTRSPASPPRGPGEKRRAPAPTSPPLRDVAVRSSITGNGYASFNGTLDGRPAPLRRRRPDVVRRAGADSATSRRPARSSRTRPSTPPDLRLCAAPPTTTTRSSAKGGSTRSPRSALRRSGRPARAVRCATTSPTPGSAAPR